MRILRSAALLIVNLCIAGCTSTSVHVTGYFPEIELVSPDSWPDLRLASDERVSAARSLNQTYWATGKSEDVSFSALLTINHSGAVQLVQDVSASDAKLRREIANALTSLRFYVTPNNNMNEMSGLSHSVRDVQAPPTVEISVARALPEELRDVRVIVRFVYRDYWDNGRNKWQ